MSGKNDGLPDGWTSVTLSDLGSWTGGGTPSKRNAVFWGGEIPWVSPKDMKAIRLGDSQNHITLEAVQESAAKLFPANSIAFVVRSGILEHTLPVALIEPEATANQDMRILTPNPDVNPTWLLFALLGAAEDIRRSCRKDGTTVASIEVPELQRFSIGLPPRGEQDQIVGAVEAATAGIAEGDESLNLIGSRLESLELSVLHSAFRGRLVHSNPGDHELEGTHSHGLSEAAIELPRTWIERPLGEVADHVLGKMLDKDKNQGSPRPYLRNINVQWGRIDRYDLKEMRIKDDEVERYGVRRGDLLVCEGGEPGRCAVWEHDEPAFIQKALHRVRPHECLSAHFLAEYLRYASKRLLLQRHFTGSTIRHLPGVRLAKIPIPIPPRAEQERIVAAVAGARYRISQMRNAIQEERARSEALRRSIFRHALTGQLVTQDSGDEAGLYRISPAMRTRGSQ